MDIKDIEDWLKNKSPDAPHVIGELAVDIDGVHKRFPANLLSIEGSIFAYFGSPIGEHLITDGYFAIRCPYSDIGKDIDLPQVYSYLAFKQASTWYQPEGGTLKVNYDESRIHVYGGFNARFSEGSPVTTMMNGVFSISWFKGA
ncbi:hypothetical protein [Pseudomonas putida]|uniref:hypothetical protein n=1 Tax=Pseudomonas putida TaxID=303 RepID=UPI003D98698C